MMTKLVRTEKGYLQWAGKTIRDLKQQNAALVEALSGSDELIDRLKGHFGDWWGGSKIAHKTVEIQQANRQALALAEGDE